tara:strand:- start:364 stop:687 length:324 start_codon:yes stop_codon:yes gene_type:complete
MNRLTELSISVVLLFSALYIECTPESIKIIRTDIKTKSWLIGLLAITIFCLTVALYERHDKEHKERLIESLKKAIMAFIIAYLAHLDFTLVPFWLVFIVAFFFHDWI